MMKHVNKYLSLALALVLCLSLAACGESNEDYGDDGSDYNLYGVPAVSYTHLSMSILHSDVTMDLI